ncbi:hypothetical protein R1sor_026122 [Riccia sorocarpa]|uniref:Endonuclease/exonuclease/phosphatase domain-containing protein n=1 Tax=Riccia sorocarpa TaxID=122646 RepID=A0ABD3GG64_9MARC
MAVEVGANMEDRVSEGVRNMESEAGYERVSARKSARSQGSSRDTAAEKSCMNQFGVLSNDDDDMDRRSTSGAQEPVVEMSERLRAMEESGLGTKKGAELDRKRGVQGDNVAESSRAREEHIGVVGAVDGGSDEMLIQKEGFGGIRADAVKTDRGVHTGIIDSKGGGMEAGEGTNERRSFGQERVVNLMARDDGRFKDSQPRKSRSANKQPRIHSVDGGATKSDAGGRANTLQKEEQGQSQPEITHSNLSVLKVGQVHFGEGKENSDRDTSMSHDRFGRAPKKKSGKRSGESKGKKPTKSWMEQGGSPDLSMFYDIKNGSRKRRALGDLDGNGCRRVDDWDNFLEGAARPSKARAVKQSILKHAKNCDILAIQEVKVSSWKINRWLASVGGKRKVVYDKPIGTRGGTALLIQEGIEVLESGTTGNGRCAWARVRSGEEVIGVASIHAPNKRRLRVEFWERLQTVIRNDQWILLGDYNQVELPEDSRGKTVQIKGREERQWRQMSLEKGLVDGMFVAASTEGQRLTRIARRRSRLDCSRLDRVYITRGAEWIDHVRSVTHHHTSSLLDHVPITVVVQIHPEEHRKAETYFKMSVFDLKNPVTLEKVKEAWSLEPLMVRDDKRKWMRGWHRVKQVLRGVRAERESSWKQEGSLESEVEWRRSVLTADTPESELEALQLVERKLKAKELYEARLWRVRSRVKWFSEDDVPSRYFFAKLKMKWARESLEVLETDGGGKTSDKDEILAEIEEFYRDLYTDVPESSEKAEARTEILGLLENKITDMEWEKMSGRPDKQEIEEVVFRFKPNKSPGHDGLTADVLKECWSFVGDDCVKFVHAVVLLPVLDVER